VTRLVGIIFLVLGIWIGVEVYTEGIDGAFGGILGSGTEVSEARSTPERARDAFQRAYDQSEERVNRQLDPDVP